MKEKTSIKWNFMMNAFLSVSGFIFPLITFPYVSRILLPIGTGKVSFATSVVSYFAMLAQLGIPTYGIRVCAQVRDDKEELSRTVQELLLINLAMSAFAYVCFFIALFTVPRFQSEKPLFLIISSTIFLNVIGVEWLYKALEQYTYITVRSVIFKALALAMMFLLVHEQKDYVIYGAISIFASAASNVMNFFHAHRLIQVKPVGAYRLKRHFKPIAVFFAMSCATVIYTNLDTVMLGFMKTDVEVGYYNAAVKIKSVLLGVVTSLGTVLLPRASYYIGQGMKDKFLEISEKAIRFVVMIALPLSVYLIFFAKESVFFLSGTAYAGAIVPMQIIMPTLLCIGLTNIMGIQMLVPLGREKAVLYSEIAGAVVDLILNAVWIPRLGASGAALGTLMAEIVVWIVQYRALHDKVKEAYRSVRYGVLTVAIVLASAASLWVKILNLHPFAALLISALLFFGVYFGILVVFGEPLALEVKQQLAGCRKKLRQRMKSQANEK